MPLCLDLFLSKNASKWIQPRPVDREAKWIQHHREWAKENQAWWTVFQPVKLSPQFVQITMSTAGR